MFIEKPLWVCHEVSAGNKAAIYSIDLHPDGTKFATSGGDNNIKIWSSATIFEKTTVDNDTNYSNQLLATLSYHQQAVNSIKWSNSGRYLASGSDDSTIMLYELKQGKAPAPSFGSNNVQNLENWCQCVIFRSHTMDIQDIAWSPDDRMLASCSIDNQVIIWKVDALASSIVSQPLKILKGHHGWVKGVIWDPVGKYLASAGDDKLVIVWRVEDWEIEEKITSPFENCTNSTHFYRISWSPDGSNFCTTNAFKSKQHVAALVERSTWENKVDLVGHREPVCAAKFNPRLFLHSQKQGTEYACCAIAGEDCSISVWVTKTSRPLAVIKDSFKAPIMDLAWSSDGYQLFGCSLDGSICCFEFEKEEIGNSISPIEQNRLLQQKYGHKAGVTLTSAIVENAVQLKYEESPTKSPNKPFNPSVQKTSSSSSSFSSSSSSLKRTAPQDVGTTSVPPLKKTVSTASVSSLKKSVVTVRADGKKRIAPVLISSNNNDPSIDSSPKPIGENFLPVDQELATTMTTTTKENNSSNLGSGSAEGGAAFGSTTPPPPPSSSSSTSTTTTTTTTTTTNSVVPGVVHHAKKGKVSPEKKKVKGLKRQQPPRQLAELPLLNAPTDSKNHDKPSQIPNLPQLSPRKSHVYHMKTFKNNNKSNSPLVIECQATEEGTSVAGFGEGSSHSWSTLTCSREGKTQWMDRVPGKVICITGNECFTAVAVENHSLYLLSHAGRRLVPCLILEGAVSVLESSSGKSPYLLIILVNGSIKVWDIDQLEIIHSESISHILESILAEGGSSKKVGLVKARISNTGLPVLTFFGESVDKNEVLFSYTFHKGLKCWTRIADQNFSHSDFHSVMPLDISFGEIESSSQSQSQSSGPLAQLQRVSCQSKIQQHGAASSMLAGVHDPVLQGYVTRSHLENQIAAALALESALEYKHWLILYVKHLTLECDEPRLREICKSFIGPTNTPSCSNKLRGLLKVVGNTWSPTVLGISKRKCLKCDLLPLMAKNRNLQRVINEYQLELEEIVQREKAVESGGFPLSSSDKSIDVQF